MATVFIGSEAVEVEFLDLTGDYDISSGHSSPTLQVPSCGGNSDDTLVDDGSAELGIIQRTTSTDCDRCKSEDTIMDDSGTVDEAVVVKPKPITGSDIPFQRLQLTKLQEPPLCKQHPDRRDEIRQLFLKRTTFTAEVWTNYTATRWQDCADGQRFFDEEARVRDCGKLQPRNRGALDRIKSLNPRDFEMMKIALDIGTPFRPLFRIVLAIRDGHLKVDWNDLTDGTHYHLSDFVRACCREIAINGLLYGKKGMTVQDLESYAALFVKEDLDVGRSF